MLLTYAVVAGLVFLGLIYIADLSIRQSAVLSLLFASVLAYVEHLRPRTTSRFSPYYLIVAPKWFQILTDFKLLPSPEHWQTIETLIDQIPKADYCLLRDNIRFTVLYPENSVNRSLVYRNTLPFHGYFITKIDFVEDINPLSFAPDSDLMSIFGKDVPNLFVRSGPDGINLGIVLPAKYWEQMKASCPEPIRMKHEYATGQVELTLAIVPYREFDLYWEPLESLSKIRARIDEERKRFAWKTNKHDDIPELTINWPEVIEHTYFRVEHNTI